jgi:tetratricopeptide (TPR) repeat protein
MLGSSLYEGGDAQGALEALRQAQEAAGVTGQRVAALRSRMDELAITVRVEPGTVADALAEVETAIEELKRADDAEALGRAWRALIEIGFVQEDYELVGRASEQLLGCARRTGIRREEVWAVRGVAAGLAYGPAPVDEAIPRVEGALAEFSRERAGEDHLALLYAYAGRFEDADRAMERSRNIRLELGQTLDHAGLAVDDTFIALLAGHPDRAEPVLEAAAKVFERAGESDYAAGIQGLMAEVLYALGRYEDAEHRTRLSEQAFPAGTAWHATRAKLLARRGATDEALRLSAAAVEHLRRSNSPHFLGDALCDRAEVLTLLGRPSEAIPLLEEALGLFERKGIVPLVERTRERLADLRAAAS